MKLRRRNQVRCQSEFPSGAIDQALEQVRGLRASRAAVGVDRYSVGVDASYPHVNDGRAVHARHHARSEVGNVGAELGQIAPRFPMMSKRIARKRPSAASATSPVEKLSRPCKSPVK